MTQRASDFLIWRAGTSVNWQCSAKDIADEVKLTRKTVQDSCNRRGWKLVHGESGRQEKRFPVDDLMSKPWLMHGGAT
jgi:hypothetical protein